MQSLNFLLILVYFVVSSSSQSLNIFGCTLTRPECPNANITFFLYTRETQDNPVQLDLSDPKSVINAKYAKDQPLIILIHGYTGDKDYSPNSHVRPAYFERGEFNVISVDYKELAKYPCYYTAVANVGTVGNCTAQLIDFMLDHRIFDIDAIHVIGFSLGAQTAGLMVNYLSGERKLKRITGLDPAKPLFIRVGNDGRLDESDADFVE
jgi:pimeloyl-ACP methyl ester carboxylesterase